MIRNEEVEEQLQRILASSAFIGSARSKQFLSFCVNRAQNGGSSQIKETTIAIEVFRRAADYDPKSDPIVRVHARRVRDKLNLYYSSAGMHDPITIDLPKGGYVPVILRAPHQGEPEIAECERATLVTRQHVSQSLPTSVSVSTSSAGHRTRTWLVRIAALLAVALLSFSAAWVWRGRHVAQSTGVGPLLAVGNMPDMVSDERWSPDGAVVAFSGVGRDNNTSHIYLKKLASHAVPFRLTDGEEAESRPVWSQDGQELAFVRSVDLTHFDLVRCRLADRTITIVGRFVSYWPKAFDPPTLDWSPDGRYLLTSVETAPSTPVQLVRIALATGERSFMSLPPIRSSGDFEARFSPDGQRIAFRRGGLGDLYVMSSNGEQAAPATRLTFDTRGVRGIAWIDGGRSLLFGSQRGTSAAFGLWKVPIAGGSPESVTPDGFDAISPTVSVTGTLMLEHRELATELIRQPLDNASSAQSVLSSNSTDSAPMYSPDGKTLAFISTRTGWGELWLQSLDRTIAPVQLTHLEGSGLIFLPAWAPDGRSIVFSLRRHGATNIVIYNIASRTTREVTSTRNRDFGAVYSSDGRFLFFSCNDDGVSRVWRVRADGSGRPEPLFLEAVSGFLPSPDGRWLYWVQRGDQITLMRQSLTDGTISEVLRLPGRPTFISSLAAAHQSIYLAMSQDDNSTSEIERIQPDTKHVETVARLSGLPPLSEVATSGFTISPDGKNVIADHTSSYKSAFYTTSFAR